MRTHVSRTVFNCFAVLRQIWSIHRSLMRPVLQSLVISFVMPWLDYGNATLAGLLDNQLSRLQFVLNAVARLVFSTRKHESVSPLICDLRWLRVPQRIDFKLAVLTYRCLHSTAASYLADELCRVVDVDICVGPTVFRGKFCQIPRLTAANSWNSAADCGRPF